VTSASGAKTGKLAASWGVFSGARSYLLGRSEPHTGETPDLLNLPSQGPRLPPARSLQGACV
jgi:hypothetical protein